MAEEIILKAESISKSFGGVKALQNVSFELKKGEILSVIGENGAGKSTLMKIVAGALKNDKGEIYFESISKKTDNSSIVCNCSYLPIIHEWL